jgi:hypothetical protein
MTFDYDTTKPEESAKQIYSELRSLPSEIRKNLQRLLREKSIIEPEKKVSPELAMPHLRSFLFASDEDFHDVEF